MSLDDCSTYGVLYVVATPIGNLDDMSLRAVETLRQVHLIACEDTRHSGHLLRHYEIENNTIAYHQHNEQQAGNKIIERLKSGQDVALVADAGTPLISDPGYVLVQKAHDCGIKVSPIPGCCALIGLLSVSGLDTKGFYFEGFLPSKSQQRQKRLQQLLPAVNTRVFYESSHRIMACLADLRDLLGAAHLICVGRELSKRYESIYHGSVGEVLSQLERDPKQQKGEFVVAVAKTELPKNQPLNSQAEQLCRQLQPLLPPKQVAKIVAEHHRCNKKEVYQYVLQL